MFFANLIKEKEMRKGFCVNYEWVLEVLTIDDDGDVLEREPFQSKEISMPENPGEVYFEEDGKQKMTDEFCLVRDVWDTEFGDLEDRTWAYVETKDKNEKWILPEHFDNGVKVPKRFHNELFKIQ
tara:strand:- start:88 stop:462 length:375 start_codon:yes stop_codon:yes gene_type:complete